MWQAPFVVGRIAMEAAVEVIMDAAGNHVLERVDGHVTTVGLTVLQQKQQARRLRKLRCRPEAALQFIIQCPAGEPGTV